MPYSIIDLITNSPSEFMPESYSNYEQLTNVAKNLISKIKDSKYEKKIQMFKLYQHFLKSSQLKNNLEKIKFFSCDTSI